MNMDAILELFFKSHQNKVTHEPALGNRAYPGGTYRLDEHRMIRMGMEKFNAFAFDLRYECLTYLGQGGLDKRRPEL